MFLPFDFQILFFLSPNTLFLVYSFSRFLIKLLVLSFFLLKTLDFKDQFLVGLFEKSDFSGTILDVLPAVEDSLFELCDDMFVLFDFFDVL